MDDLYEVPCGFVFGVTIVLVFVMLCSAQIVHIKHCFRTYGVFSTQCWFLLQVCEEARCPNIGECWGGGEQGTATATIMVGHVLLCSSDDDIFFYINFILMGSEVTKQDQA